MANDPLRRVRVHVTAADIFGGEAITRAEVIERLSRLSVYDCIYAIGRISAVLHWESRLEAAVQRQLVDWIAAPVPKLLAPLRAAIGRGQFAFFEQQLVHLARLALIHADLRLPDNFLEGRVVRDMLFCLFGVTDEFDDDIDDVRDPQERLSWVLRQAAMNRNQERLSLWSIYYELFLERWADVPNAAERDADEAFRCDTGIGVADFLALAFGFVVGVGQPEGEGNIPRGAVLPEKYFSTTALGEQAIERFLAQTAATAEALRASLLEEEARWGDTTYAALAIERTPLLRGPDGTIYVINSSALERRSTYGIFHILAEAGPRAGFDREHFTSPFGGVFQRWVEESLTRWLDRSDAPPHVFADLPYGTRKQPRDTPDLVFRYPRDLVAVEVVAGSFRAQTLTRGDVATFTEDMERLVFKKAKQLNDRLEEIDAGDAAHIGLTTDGVTRIWPMIVMPADFPHWPDVLVRVRSELKRRQLLQGKRYRPIALVTAEEIVAAEVHFEAGASLLEILVAWKASPASGDQPLKNFLVDRAAAVGLTGKLPTYHAAKYEEASKVIFRRIFDHEPPVDYHERLVGNE
jgi:hypothetical protein